MHRSGTSATAGVLAALGAATGEHLVPPDPWNQRGHFELQDAVDINERCLAGLGLSWNAVQPLPPGWLGSRAALDASDAVEALFRDQFRSTSLCMVKDPRLCRLLPVWLRGMARQDVSARVLIVLRPPSEVAASLDVRDGIDADHANALWLLHLLEVEAASQQVRRAVLDYGRLLANWRSEVARIAGALGLRLNTADPAAVEQVETFLSRELRHHDEHGAAARDSRPFPTVIEAADALSALSKDLPVADGTFEKLRQRLDEGLALWHRGAPSATASGRKYPSALDLVGLLELALHRSPQEVMAVYWRNAGEDYVQSRSASSDYTAQHGAASMPRVRLPCATPPQFLRVDPAMAPGVYRIVSLTLDGEPFAASLTGRVNGIALAPRADELIRICADHDDPWFEIDLGESGVPLAPGCELAVEVERIGLLEAMDRRLAGLERIIQSKGS